MIKTKSVKGDDPPNVLRGEIICVHTMSEIFIRMVAHCAYFEGFKIKSFAFYEKQAKAIRYNNQSTSLTKPSIIHWIKIMFLLHRKQKSFPILLLLQRSFYEFFEAALSSNKARLCECFPLFPFTSGLMNRFPLLGLPKLVARRFNHRWRELWIQSLGFESFHVSASFTHQNIWK